MSMSLANTNTRQEEEKVQNKKASDAIRNFEITKHVNISADGLPAVVALGALAGVWYVGKYTLWGVVKGVEAISEAVGKEETEPTIKASPSKMTPPPPPPPPPPPLLTHHRSRSSSSDSSSGSTKKKSGE
jgi:Tfp pilus assembly protein PilX